MKKFLFDYRLMRLWDNGPILSAVKAVRLLHGQRVFIYPPHVRRKIRRDRRA
jgi:hypothetical protein